MERLDKIKAVFSHNDLINKILLEIEKNQAISIENVIGSGRAFMIEALITKSEKPFICLLPEEEEAKGFYDDLTELMAEDQIKLFSAHGKQLWNEVGAKSPVVGRRIDTLKSLLNKQIKVVISSAQAIIEKVAAPQKLQKTIKKISRGGVENFDSFIEYLIGLGYIRELRVERPGEISVRGGLIDIFLFEEQNPFRIEFYGDEIETIRVFDLQSQRSVSSLKSIEFLPLSAAGLYGPYIDHPFDRLEFEGNLLDYISKNFITCYFDKQLFINELTMAEEECEKRFNVFIQEQLLSREIEFDDFYNRNNQITQKLNNKQIIDIPVIRSKNNSLKIDLQMQRNSHFAGNLPLFKKETELYLKIKNSIKLPKQILVLSDSEIQATRMNELFAQEGFPPEVEALNLNLAEGFQWPSHNLSIYTNRELYGRLRISKVDKLSNRNISFDEILKFMEGDFIVHIDYGVGIFRGLQLITAYGKTRECIQIEYADGDQLYVPFEKMDRVQKFSSREGYTPILNKLGAKDWERLKSRTKKQVKEIAEQLIKLYAMRKIKTGYAFSSDTVWQKELEASFIYEETIDQLSAIRDIKDDMERPIPMDRLICGDVGFGKTEVAVRAAFKALNDNKQVAVLVPTTVLAQQHFNTFLERLKRFPIKIDVLSRFKKPLQQAEIIEKLAKGKIDLIIGTHRLLSKDVHFKELGLLIIDEEQKFGVIHKERLKLLKTSVDTISLSATPIPRTLHMALVGARDLSLINTPPNNRLSIKTEVCRFDKGLIRNVILQEVSRGGQVFFIHNRVNTIYAILNLLRELIPEVSFAVAHGQMRAHDLEKVMLAFSNGKIQCLVCTMIIESGIDVPNANTLIVNKANHFGLSQLYQLRGRVGRANHQAYAYFLVPPLRKLTRTAIKRLQTIQEYSHLGAGYKIAIRDLEIRGAGNIFGAEQSGFVDALGFELFTKIIEESIQELRGELNLDKKKEEKQLESRIEINSEALLPSDYVQSASDRVDLYRRLIEAKDSSAIGEIEQEIRDRYGELPTAAKNLIDYLNLKDLSRQTLIEEISVRDGKAIGKFNSRLIPKGEHFKPWIGKIVKTTNQRFELKQNRDELYFELTLLPSSSSLEQVKNFLQSII